MHRINIGFSNILLAIYILFVCSQVRAQENERLPDWYFVQFFRDLLSNFCGISEVSSSIEFAEKWVECKSILNSVFDSNRRKLFFYNHGKFFDGVPDLEVDSEGVFLDLPTHKKHRIFKFDFYPMEVCEDSNLDQEVMSTRSIAQKGLCLVQKRARELMTQSFSSDLPPNRFMNFTITKDTSEVEGEEQSFKYEEILRDLMKYAEPYLQQMMQSGYILKFEPKITGNSFVLKVLYEREVGDLNGDGVENFVQEVNFSFKFRDLDPFIDDQERESFFEEQWNAIPFKGFLFLLDSFPPRQNQDQGNGLVYLSFEELSKLVENNLPSRNAVSSSFEAVLLGISASIVEFYFGAKTGDFSEQNGNPLCDPRGNMSRVDLLPQTNTVVPCRRTILEIDMYDIDSSLNLRVTSWLRGGGYDMQELRKIAASLGYQWNHDTSLWREILIASTEADNIRNHLGIEFVNLDSVNRFLNLILEPGTNVDQYGLEKFRVLADKLRDASVVLVNAHGEFDAFYLAKLSFYFEFSSREQRTIFDHDVLPHKIIPRLDALITRLFMRCFRDREGFCVDVVRHRHLLAALIFCHLGDFSALQVYFGREMLGRLCVNLARKTGFLGRPLTDEEKSVVDGFSKFFRANMSDGVYSLTPTSLKSKAPEGFSLKSSHEQLFTYGKFWSRFIDVGIGCYCHKWRFGRRDPRAGYVLETLNHPYILDMLECLSKLFNGSKWVTLSLNNKVKVLDRLLGRDLAGRQVVTNSSLESFSGSLWNFSYPYDLPKHYPPLTETFNHPPHVEDLMRITWGNSRYHLLNFFWDGQLRQTLTSNVNYHQPYAIVGTTHSNFNQGARRVTLPVPNFHTNPRFKYNLRSFQDSIKNRGSFYFLTGSSFVLPFWESFVEGSFRLLALDPRSKKGNVIWDKPAMVNPFLNQARYPGWFEVGDQTVKVELAPSVYELDYSPSAKALAIQFTSFLADYHFKVKISNKNAYAGTARIQGWNKQTDVSRYVVQDHALVGGDKLVIQFKTGVPLMTRDEWELSLHELWKKYGEVHPDREPHYSWPYFLEIHLIGRSVNGTPLIGNNVSPFEGMFMPAIDFWIHFPVYNASWIWPAPESSLVSSDLSHIYKMRSPPYLFNLGQLYLIDYENWTGAFRYYSGGNWLNKKLILRIPLSAGRQACVDKIQTGYNIENYSAGEDGNGLCKCEGDYVGECHTCNGRIYWAKVNGSECKDDVPYYKCKLGGGTCCPRQNRCSDENQPCDTPIEFFESEEEKQIYISQCSERGGTFIERRCRWLWPNARCCGDPELVEAGINCDPTTSGGCCPPPAGNPPTFGNNNNNNNQGSCSENPWVEEHFYDLPFGVGSCGREVEMCPGDNIDDGDDLRPCEDDPGTQNTENTKNNNNGGNNSNNSRNANNTANTQNSNNSNNSNNTNNNNNTNNTMNTTGSGTGDCVIYVPRSNAKVKGRSQLRKIRRDKVLKIKNKTRHQRLTKPLRDRLTKGPVYIPMVPTCYTMAP